ncbi:MAG: hypothetical protein M1818_007110 [Claussenomyces sp. TS43310]|nr:MAG: hypothetical protein M1818_007110 [Claussenomyces sp. TS43310]
MEAFISRKRRRIALKSATQDETSNLSRAEPDDNDSTEFKLAILASLYPKIDHQILLDVLLAHDGSVDEASASLLPRPTVSPHLKSSSSTGYQSSLAAFSVPSNALKSPRLMSKKGKTLHLYSPEDVAAHTPCSIIHNFLPGQEANDLLVELLDEAQTFESMTFKLFENVVKSPHTMCLYVQSGEEQSRQKTEYIYNGALMSDVRQITPHMRKISTKVSEAVNAAIAERIRTHYPNQRKLKYQSPAPWSPNAAFVNQYSGGQESVGYHSDQLTYLGPRAVIGSLSLGVAREFRVRRVVPQESENQMKTTSSVKPASRTKEDTDLTGQISIHLPHNSLLVMHAEMQEEWKHSIAPASIIDPHPIAGTRRINITYRDFKASLHPRFTPKCRCNVPTVLRVVQRKKENWGRYFWLCHAGNVPGKEG